MTNLQRFGGLIGLTVLLALLADLIFGPALLRAVYGQSARGEAPPQGDSDASTAPTSTEV